MRRPRRPRRPLRPENDELRVNGRIRVPRVLVIDNEGNRLGEFLTEDAVRLAQERGLDLVEVAPDGRPPVCRIADYGRMKYDRKKKEAAARRNQVHVQNKEVKLRPKTDDHDMAVKVRNTMRFLNAGHKVKITVRFRGREMAHRDIGAQQCLRIADACGDLCTIESHPRMDGRQMFMILAPTKKPQPRRREEKQRKGQAPTDPEEVEGLEHDPDDDINDDELDQLDEAAEAASESE
ncbi:MAG: translation initiation factor IF-3 [Proteobacteria bacterium]|nr:translation initiation factor IF-3 [Pseudomonadota bacterium]